MMRDEYAPSRDPGGAWDQAQTREMERDAAVIARERFDPYRSPAERRIAALEACLRDFVRDFGCDHAAYEWSCSGCEARRLLGLPTR